MHSKNINVFDFDGTLYNGDSSVDFFKYCLFKNKKNMLLLPKIVIYFILFIFKIVKKEKFKSIFFSFMKNMNNHEKLIREFWDKHEDRLNPSLKYILDENSVIVSASPLFLINEISKRLKIKCIASNVDIKTGKWLDNNCHGENKIKYLDKEYKDYNIEKSYGDSYSDHYIADKSNEAYMVRKKKIYKYNENRLYLDKIGREGLFISLLFLIIYFVLGMVINYCFTNVKNNFDFFFEGDVARVYGDFVELFYNHYRISVHPLILLFQPIILMLHSAAPDKVIALVLFNSIVGTLSVKYLYQLIRIYNKNKFSSIILVSIFGFSFTSLIFNSIFEIYGLSALFLILIWYSIIKDIKYDDRVSFIKYVGLGSICTGILLTNITVFGVGMLTLLLSKKISFIKFIFINISVVLTVILLSFFQQKVWINVPNIMGMFNGSTTKTEMDYVDYHITIDKAKNVFDDVYMNGFISHNTHFEFENGNKKYLSFNDKYNYKDSIFIIFYVLLIFKVIKCKKDKKQKIINLGLTLSMIGMSVLHMIYGNSNTFLYSANILYLIIALYGINYGENKKVGTIFLFIFLLYEILNNAIKYKRLIKLVNKHFTRGNLLIKIGLYKSILLFAATIIFTIIIVYVIYNLIKKYIEKHEGKYLVTSFICLMLIAFTYINTIAYNHYDNKTNSEKIVSINISKDMEEKYPNELKAYKKYKEQYKKLVDQDKCEVKDIVGSKRFYLFGLTNREKYVYSNGYIRNVYTEEIYKKFNVKKEIIIPNINTVLISTTDGKYYKIVEDEYNVRIISDNEEILPGTSVKISLPTFSEYRYSEILKVIYSEILFNIKNNIMYSNSILDDKINYQDASSGVRVLADNNDTKYIKEWLSKIDNDSNIKKGDLPSILYLLSSIDDKEQAIDIIKKLDVITARHDNGIHIHARSDKNNVLAYQTDLIYLDSNELRKYIFIDKKKYNIKKTDKKDENTKIVFNTRLYPLSSTEDKTFTSYSKLHVVNDYFVDKKSIPTYTKQSEKLYFFIKEQG